MSETKQEDPRPLSRSELERLVDAGLIRPEKRDEALAMSRKDVDWFSWTQRWTMALGATFLLAGVLFFFAWNWKELSPFVRFAVLQGAIVIAVGAALFGGLSKPAGQWGLLAAMVLTGVLLAVFGQVYQTGADAFEVFALWAGLTVVWAVVACSPVLWILWLTILQTAILTFSGQVILPGRFANWDEVYLVLGLVSGLALFLREWAEHRESLRWFREEWVRLVLVGVTVFWLSAIPWSAIFEFRWWNSESAPLGRWIGIPLWVAAMAGGAWFYGRVRPSLTSAGLCLIAAATIVTTWIGKEIIDGAEDSPIAWLIASVVALLAFAGVGLLIARTARLHSGAREEVGV